MIDFGLRLPLLLFRRLVLQFRRLLLYSSATPAALAALMSTTAGATSAAAAPTSAAMSAATASLGKLRRYQFERRMSTICLVHSFVCLGRSYGFRGEELF